MSVSDAFILDIRYAASGNEVTKLTSAVNKNETS